MASLKEKALFVVNALGLGLLVISALGIYLEYGNGQLPSGEGATGRGNPRPSPTAIDTEATVRILEQESEQSVEIVPGVVAVAPEPTATTIVYAAPERGVEVEKKYPVITIWDGNVTREVYFIQEREGGPIHLQALDGLYARGFRNPEQFAAADILVAGVPVQVGSGTTQGTTESPRAEVVASGQEKEKKLKGIVTIGTRSSGSPWTLYGAVDSLRLNYTTGATFSFLITRRGEVIQQETEFYHPSGLPGVTVQPGDVVTVWEK